MCISTKTPYWYVFTIYPKKCLVNASHFYYTKNSILFNTSLGIKKPPLINGGEYFFTLYNHIKSFFKSNKAESENIHEPEKIDNINETVTFRLSSNNKNYRFDMNSCTLTEIW